MIPNNICNLNGTTPESAQLKMFTLVSVPLYTSVYLSSSSSAIDNSMVRLDIGSR